MCNSKAKSVHAHDHSPIARINGRPVLQPACNHVAALDRCNSLKKKTLPKSPPPPSPPPITTTTTTNDNNINALSSTPCSPKSKATTVRPVVKRVDDSNGLKLNVIDKNCVTPRLNPPRSPQLTSKKSMNLSQRGVSGCDEGVGNSYFGPFVVDAPPGSIAEARREQVTLIQAQQKMRIAHYGRTPSKLESNVVLVDSSAANEKRCSFITPNSDPLYVAYHDEEWGVPVHDDRMLFELLVLSGAQVGLDWTSILRKRDDFRAAFAGFDIEAVAKFNQRQVASISEEYSLDLSRIRGAVDNANCIWELRRQFGSFDKYLWAFVNYKPIMTNYRSCRKIPAKTSKSETISKDMVRRGFRLVGPTVVHSFMQAVGLTNDHLITCPRHLQCSSAHAAH